MANNNFISSTTSDIVLTPASHPKGSKKPLIIALAIVAVVVIIAIIVLLSTASNRSGGAILQSFDKFANFLYSGDEDRPGDGHTVYSISMVSTDYYQSNSTIEAQHAYAQTLSEKYKDFKKNLEAVELSPELEGAIADYDKTIITVLNYINLYSLSDTINENFPSWDDDKKDSFLETYFFSDDSNGIAYASYLIEKFLMQRYYNYEYCEKARCVQDGNADYSCASRYYRGKSGLDFSKSVSEEASFFSEFTQEDFVDAFRKHVVVETEGLRTKVKEVRNV